MENPCRHYREKAEMEIKILGEKDKLRKQSKKLNPDEGLPKTFLQQVAYNHGLPFPTANFENSRNGKNEHRKRHKKKR